MERYLVRNVVVQWQILHSFKTNLLDLGIWMGLQSYIEYLQSKKVMNLNVTYQSQKGNNILVGSYCGIKTNLINLPTVPEYDPNNEVIIRKLRKAI